MIGKPREYFPAIGEYKDGWIITAEHPEPDAFGHHLVDIECSTCAHRKTIMFSRWRYHTFASFCAGCSKIETAKRAERKRAIKCAERAGVKQRKALVREQRHQRCTELRAQGLSHAEIGKREGICQSMVCYILKGGR